jgi:hypothetical protein
MRNATLLHYSIHYTASSCVLTLIVKTCVLSDLSCCGLGSAHHRAVGANTLICKTMHLCMLYVLTVAVKTIPRKVQCPESVHLG